MLIFGSIRPLHDRYRSFQRNYRALKDCFLVRLQQGARFRLRLSRTAEFATVCKSTSWTAEWLQRIGIKSSLTRNEPKRIITSPLSASIWHRKQHLKSWASCLDHNRLSPLFWPKSSSSLLVVIRIIESYRYERREELPCSSTSSLSFIIGFVASFVCLLVVCCQINLQFS